MTRLGPAQLKRLSNLSHARTRGAERYGLSLTQEQLESISAAIREGRDTVAVLRRDRDRQNRIWVAVWHESDWLPVAYDEATSSVVTCLPWDAIAVYYGHLDRLARLRFEAPGEAIRERPWDLAAELAALPTKEDVIDRLESAQAELASAKAGIKEADAGLLSMGAGPKKNEPGHSSHRWLRDSLNQAKGRHIGRIRAAKAEIRVIVAEIIRRNAAESAPIREAFWREEAATR